MQTRNVYYSQKPDEVIVYTAGDKAIIEIPTGISEVETEDGVQYIADVVYRVQTMNTANLEERVKKNLDAWIENAKETEPQKTELSDVVEALNALTEIVLGGEL